MKSRTKKPAIRKPRNIVRPSICGVEGSLIWLESHWLKPKQARKLAAHLLMCAAYIEHTNRKGR